MRFMIIVNASMDSGAGVMAGEQPIATMAAYHEDFGPSEAVERFRETGIGSKK
jgi:hypothetical protein